MIDTLMHYPETPNTRPWIARSACIDDFLLMLLKPQGYIFSVLVLVLLSDSSRGKGW